MKIVSVFGARPQFVKAAMVSRQFKMNGDVQEVAINTGQHYDALMSDVFLQDLEMNPPDYNLEVGSASHGVQTARILERTEVILLREKPDCVVVYGDTNSTLGGALAAAKLNIPLAHVEAGMRSFDRRAPEEHNRVVTDHLADLLLTPSEITRTQLLREGIPDGRIALVGDVMYDAVLHHLVIAEHNSRIREQLNLLPQGYVLCTIHRAANTDDPARLLYLMRALERVAEYLPVVFPVHPRSRKVFDACGLAGRLDERLIPIDPVGYLDMIALERNAAVVATDSGGVQKEAFFLEVPCVTLREETEWTELVATGWTRLAPPDGSADVAEIILSSVGKTGQLGVRPYGDGNAARKVCDAVLELIAASGREREAVAV
jgi:UDP-GlcNAc3NAcA epimerase